MEADIDYDSDYIAFSRPNESDLFCLMVQVMRIGPIIANADYAPRFECPERNMWVAILVRALLDATYTGKSSEKLHAKQDALEWIFLDKPYLGSESVDMRDQVIQFTGIDLEYCRRKLKPYWNDVRSHA